MVSSIGRLQRAGAEPDVWMIEGLDRREDDREVVEAARKGDRDRVGFIGFAVGRTTFGAP
jgi:hypothetical protein